MGRKPKVTIDPNDLESMDKNEVSTKDLAEKYGVDNQYIHNIKHKRKLKTTFTLNQADQAMSAQGGVTANENSLVEGDRGEQVGGLEPSSAQTQQPYIDPAIAVKGLYKGADMILKLMSVMSRGKLEYTTVPDDELDKLTELTKNDQGVQKVANIQGLSSMIVVGSIAHTFGSRMKIVKEEKHKKDDPKCQCKKCIKNRKKLEEHLENVAQKANESDGVEIPTMATEIVEELKENQYSNVSGSEEDLEKRRDPNTGIILETNSKNEDLKF